MDPLLLIGERLAEERKRLGWNQTDFAATALITRKTLYGYETGVRAPDAEALSAWAACGLDVLYVVTGKHSGTAAAAVGASQPEPALTDRARLEAAISAVEEGLAEARRKLPPAKRAEMILAAYDLMKEPKQARASVIRLVRTAA